MIFQTHTITHTLLCLESLIQYIPHRIQKPATLSINNDPQMLLNIHETLISSSKWKTTTTRAKQWSEYYHSRRRSDLLMVRFLNTLIMTLILIFNTIVKTCRSLGSLEPFTPTYIKLTFALKLHLICGKIFQIDLETKYF